MVIARFRVLSLTPVRSALAAQKRFQNLFGAMGKRARLPVETVRNPRKHGQASTLTHGTHSASSRDDPILESLPGGDDGRGGGSSGRRKIMADPKDKTAQTTMEQIVSLCKRRG